MNIFRFISCYKYHLIMNLVVLLLGSTALIAKVVTIPSLQLTWLRMMIASFCLFPFYFFTSRIKISRSFFLILLNGIIIALHWIAFFYAVKISTISLTLIILSSAPFFTSLFDSFFYKRSINFHHLISGFFLLIGMVFIFRDTRGFLLEGSFFALIAAVGQALFTVINSRLIKKYSTFNLVFYELLSGFIFLSCFIFSFVGLSWKPVVIDLNVIFLVFFLSVICTVLCYFLSIWALNGMSAFTSNLIVNLEPFYGSYLAFLFLGQDELLPKDILLGVFFVVLCILYNFFIKLYKIHRYKKLENITS